MRGHVEGVGNYSIGCDRYNMVEVDSSDKIRLTRSFKEVPCHSTYSLAMHQVLLSAYQTSRCEDIFLVQVKW